jgi:Arm domain-containing DNA-binding protein
LHLLVMPNGAKYWRFRYRFGGKAKQLSLGVYPDVVIADARAACADLRTQRADGMDPSAVRKADRLAERARRIERAPRFARDSDGALTVRLSGRAVFLTRRRNWRVARVS